MSGRAVLRETAELIETGWCRGADARNRLGAAVEPGDPSATAWSLLGALAAVSDRPNAELDALRDALWGISGVIPDSSLEEWNDAPGRTQADALELLSRAAADLDRSPPPVLR